MLKSCEKIETNVYAVEIALEGDAFKARKAVVVERHMDVPVVGTAQGDGDELCISTHGTACKASARGCGKACFTAYDSVVHGKELIVICKVTQFLVRGIGISSAHGVF